MEAMRSTEGETASGLARIGLRIPVLFELDRSVSRADLFVPQSAVAGSSRQPRLKFNTLAVEGGGCRSADGQRISRGSLVGEPSVPRLRVGAQALC